MSYMLAHNPGRNRRRRAEALFLEATVDDRFLRESLRIVAEARERIRVSRQPTKESGQDE
ncbi:hypothetical protein WJ59_09705 [Burkholderia gladioli]|uniref:hypothetical protein n=1 Tax=Burkholderia TaxID=32008 RepID=UPI000752F50A|nr:MULTISPECIES: hypothetical protein [Burkholderia]KVM70804.1 hypothetical protein WJ59_09705 [Burkholderia gladioli]NIF69775.1 hypothetical protein [Burkholderia sp. Ap-962]NIF89087.1 hypothetical protein [Burkholderia sp. Cy-637]